MNQFFNGGDYIYQISLSCNFLLIYQKSKMMLRFKTAQNIKRLATLNSSMAPVWKVQRLPFQQLPIRAFAPPPTGSTASSSLDDLQQQAQNIQNSIDMANLNIEKNTKQGRALSREISNEVQEDQFIKQQRYEIFIAKMEQLQRADKRDQSRLKKTISKMQSTFVLSQQPLKDILFHYNKASHRGFDPALVSHTLEQLKLAFRARGNKPRVYDDYSDRELDISWRMHLVSDHIQIGLEDEQYFNHFFMANSAKQLGEIGFKDTKLIQKYFDKLNQMLTEREQNLPKTKQPLDIEKVIYGGYKNFIPKHYVFDGFESSSDFQEHLTTLLTWQTDQKDGLRSMGVEQTSNIEELETTMADLIAATHQVKDMQVGMQASIDSLRSQFFKLQEAQDKHTFLQDNKHIHYDMLELQELLVRGGFLEPQEADKMSSQSPHEVRMDRAAQIFYEYVQNYIPELMSPQYEDFYGAAQSTLQERYQPGPSISLDEMHDKISLSSLSKSLTGLANQALSFRRECNEKDYLHPFYEQHAEGGEKAEIARFGLKTSKEEGHDYQVGQHMVPSTVRMQKDYLRAYDIFNTEVERMWPRYKNLINKSKGDLEGQLHCLLGLSKSRIEAPEVREKMFNRILNLIKRNGRMRVEAVVDGLHGIALQNSRIGQDIQVATQLLNNLNQAKQKRELSFQQKLEVMWSACALGLENEQIVQELYQELNSMNFERTDNDLTFEQFNMIRDFQLYITKVSKHRNDPWVKKELNEALDQLVQHPKMHHGRYEESFCDFDPFKKRVLLGLTRGLTMASIDHQSTLEDNIFNQNKREIDFNEQLYPYAPDVIVGMNGQKVLLNVITASETMRDIKKGDGRVLFRQRITAGLQEGRDQVQSMAVPITSVINYDIENLKIEMNNDYNFMADLNSQVAVPETSLDFDKLATFGASFTREASQYLSGLKAPSDRKRVDGFFKQLYKVFQVKQQTDRQYESIIKSEGIEAMKMELMKLTLLYDAMPLHQKQYLNQFVPLQNKSFKQMMHDLKKNVKAYAKQNSAEAPRSNENLDLNWLGTRLSVELPQATNLQTKKNIVPELINQRFMWMDDYFHYDDWEKKQKDVFDGFNLLVMPRKEGETKYFYDRANNHRIVPQGIFPLPNHKREVLQAPVDTFAKQLNDGTQKGNDSLNEFEKNPYQTMVLKEKQRSTKLAPLSTEVSFITNLQNIKQGLKQDYSDKEILDMILNNMSFTDQLIQEHLGGSSKPRSQQKTDATFVDRNPQAFRDFVKNTYFSKDQEDPFSHFYIKEGGKHERIHQVYNEAQEKFQEHQHKTASEKSHEGIGNIFKTLHTKIEDMMLENQIENEDLQSLSHQLKSEVKVNYDLKSLMKSEFVYDVDPELVDSDLSNTQFLRQQRKRAETKLIKNKIIYKLDQDKELSANEKKYLKKWVEHLQKDDNCNIQNARDAMMPANFSNLNIGDALSAEDIFTFNQIPNVEIDRKKHGGFALNDLILELSHFLDEEVTNRVDMDIMSSRIREEWDLPKDFQVIETPNKEISIVLNELEEVAWRMAGTYNEGEVNTLQDMFSIQRNADTFDKAFFDNDMKSMREFITKANSFDERNQLIQEWFVRKEEEIKSRVVFPDKSMQRPDNELHERIDGKLRRARELMVSKFLINDEFGTKQDEKDYKDLTTRELNQISESISVRLNLFQGQYPSFMPQAVKAVMEHPNLSKTDYATLDSFCRMFELDWRGDRSLDNKSQFLATNPVYLGEHDHTNFRKYGDIGNFEVTTLLRLACSPFIDKITGKMTANIDEKAKK